MPRIKDIDPLLAIAKTVLGFLMAVLALAAIALVGAAIAAPMLPENIIVEMTANNGEKIAPGLVWTISALLIGVAVLVGLFAYFLLLLWRIVGTVGDGDPFVPENARRLSHMGWIALAAFVLEIIIEGLSDGLTTHAAATANSLRLETSIDLSGSALIMALVLFILARVFRTGAQMREDLEGTV